MNGVKTGPVLVKIADFRGIELFSIRTEKFKTNTVHIFLDSSITKDEAAMTALLPAVLRRGCKSYPAFRDIARCLEELYGATFDCGVVKKGERHIIHFYIEYVNDRYTTDNTRLFRQAFDLAAQILLEPVIEGEGFRKDYVKQEKNNLKNLIESRINNKVQYAVDRCLEEMCRTEPFGIYEYGSVSDLPGIDAEGLHRHYRNVMEEWPVKVYITGDASDEQLAYAQNALEGIKRGSVKKPSPVKIISGPQDVRYIEEKRHINQAKLTLGYRTNTGPSDEDYYPLLLYNGILGGGIHSKLFRNVREKAGIAYYAFSRLEKFKGLMVAGCGIDPAVRGKAEEIMGKQADDMRKGVISDYEFNSALKAMETGIKSLRDSSINMADFYLGQRVAGSNDSFDTLIEHIREVKREDVIRVAEKIKLDTVYFLSPGANE